MKTWDVSNENCPAPVSDQTMRGASTHGVRPRVVFKPGPVSPALESSNWLVGCIVEGPAPRVRWRVLPMATINWSMGVPIRGAPDKEVG